MAKRILIDKATEAAAESNEALENEISVQGEIIKGDVLQRSVTVSRRDDKWGGRKFTCPVQIDFAGVPLSQLHSWAASTLIIQLQNQLRACSHEFVATLMASAIRRPASDMGKSLNASERAEANAKRAYAALTPTDRRRMLIEAMIEMGETVSKADRDWLNANKA